MELNEVIDKRTGAYCCLCETFILVICFNDDEPITNTDNDKIITNLAIRATSENLEEDLFDFNDEKYAWVWHDSITLDEWGKYEMYATFPQEGWELF